jgi:hypothetical protein
MSYRYACGVGSSRNGCIAAAVVVVLRTDALRKQLFQINETDRPPESAYRLEITEQIYEILAQVIDASGTSEQTLIQCQARIGHSEPAQGPDSAT